MTITRSMIQWVNEIIFRRSNAAFIKDLPTDIIIPTQSDKPSPHSSLSLAQTKSQLGKYSTNKGYYLAGVANTNSMEPLFDDNCIVAMEKLDKEWGPGRLSKQPLTPGDIVVWRYGLMGIIHILVKEVDDGWIIKGWNNFKADLGGKAVPRYLIESRLVAIGYSKQQRDND